MVYFSTPSRCAESAAGVFCRASSAWARSLPAAATHRHTVARTPTAWPAFPRLQALYATQRQHARTHTHTHERARTHTDTNTDTRGPSWRCPSRASAPASRTPPPSSSAHPTPIAHARACVLRPCDSVYKPEAGSSRHTLRKVDKTQRTHARVHRQARTQARTCARLLSAFVRKANTQADTRAHDHVHDDPLKARRGARAGAGPCFSPGAARV